MSFWRSSVLGVLIGLILACAGCYGETPASPTVDARGNTGTVTANISTGSSSPVGTAPCGASSTQKTGENAGQAPNCSTTTTTTAGPKEVAP